MISLLHLIMIGTVMSANLANSIFTLINQKRRENGLPLLRSIANLESSAKDQGLYMCENSILTHSNPSGDLQQRVKRNGFLGKKIGENIAKNHSDNVEEVVKMWMNSKLHKKNILGDYTYTGLATCLDKKGSRFWVQVFGSEGKPDDEDSGNSIDNVESENTNENKKDINNVDDKNETSDDELLEKYKPDKSNKNNIKNSKKQDKTSTKSNKKEKKDKLLDSKVPKKSVKAPRSKRSVKESDQVESDQMSSEDIPIPKRVSKLSLLPEISTVSSKNRSIFQDLPKLGSIISTQIIYILTSSPSSTIPISSSAPSTISSSFPISMAASKISTTHITSFITVTRSETESISSVTEKTKTITKTMHFPMTASSTSPAISILENTISSEYNDPKPITSTSTSTLTVTRTVDVTRSESKAKLLKSFRSKLPPATTVFSTVTEVPEESESEEQETISIIKTVTQKPRKYRSKKRNDEVIAYKEQSEEDFKYFKKLKAKLSRSKKSDETSDDEDLNPKKVHYKPRRNKRNVEDQKQLLTNEISDDEYLNSQERQSKPSKSKKKAEASNDEDLNSNERQSKPSRSKKGDEISDDENLNLNEAQSKPSKSKKGAETSDDEDLNSKKPQSKPSRSKKSDLNSFANNEDLKPTAKSKSSKKTSPNKNSKGKPALNLPIIQNFSPTEDLLSEGFDISITMQPKRKQKKRGAM